LNPLKTLEKTYKYPLEKSKERGEKKKEKKVIKETLSLKV